MPYSGCRGEGKCAFEHPILSQLERLADFHTRHAAQSPAMLLRLQQAVIDNKNVFDVLMDAVRCCSLGQITNALFEMGGQYRRSM